MSCYVELENQQLAPVRFQLFFSLAAFSLAISLGTAEIISLGTLYNPLKSLQERRNTLEKVCLKYDDELKYEYNGLYNFQVGNEGSQAMVGIRDVDYVNKYFFCSNGMWDGDYMSRKVLGRSVRLNVNNETTEQFMKLRNMTGSQLKDTLKGFKRIIVVEHPFIKLVDDYHHMFVMAPLTLKGHIEEVVQHWFNLRHDKFKKQEGEKYFETSDDPNVLTFRQFINFLTKMSSETQYGRKLVSEYRGFTERWKPLWKKCTPCVKDYRYDYVVDTEHMEADLEYFVNDMSIKNSTDAQPLSVKPYTYPESFEQQEYRFADRIKEFGKFGILDGMAKDNKDQVQKLYSTLYKSEIWALYQKYKLDFELFGFSPDEFMKYGMDDGTTSK